MIKRARSSISRQETQFMRLSMNDFHSLGDKKWDGKSYLPLKGTGKKILTRHAIFDNGHQTNLRSI
jgi:hypothetical protein